MLILRRKKNESFLIGDSIRVTIIECAADGARIAIDAPKHISILREELSEAEQANLSSPIPISSATSLQSLQTVLSKFVTSAVPASAGPDTDMQPVSSENTASKS